MCRSGGADAQVAAHAGQLHLLGQCGYLVAFDIGQQGQQGGPLDCCVVVLVGITVVRCIAGDNGGVVDGGGVEVHLLTLTAEVAAKGYQLGAAGQYVLVKGEQAESVLLAVWLIAAFVVGCVPCVAVGAQSQYGFAVAGIGGAGITIDASRVYGGLLYVHCFRFWGHLHWCVAAHFLCLPLAVAAGGRHRADCSSRGTSAR